MILRARPALTMATLMLLVTGAAMGQYRRQQASQGPRAIAVIEWDAKGVPRLVPISIMIEGKWYDASLYKADPVPMALEPDTVYEATRNGDAVGLFTITGVQQFQGAWYAAGRWQEGIEPPKKETKSEPKPEAKEEDDRPRLHRPGAEPASKPQAPSAAQPAPAPQAQKEAAPPKPAEPAPKDEDVNRPILRRGRPAEEQAAQLPEPPGPPAGSPAAPGTKPKRVLVAISDAKHNEYQPFTWTPKPEERVRLTKLMTDLAARELNAFAAAHSGPKPGALQDVEMRSFDLDLSNEPIFIISARATAAPAAMAPARVRRPAKAPAEPAPRSPGAEFYVTVVARQDFNGDMHKLYSATTDSRHLDAYPRLELIDALDADGNGRGELLFRQINDRGRSFVIYRVGADRLAEIFDSSAPMQ